MNCYDERSGCYRDNTERTGSTERIFKGAKKKETPLFLSLEGIIQENNRKEEIINRLEYLKSEKDKLLESVDKGDDIFASDVWKTLTRDMEQTMKDVKTALQKNMKLLSFSIDM
jgi:hypothetical protein